MAETREVTELMTITPLGGGQEVGRSCIMLTYQDRNIMLDCGTHPGRKGESGLPFFDTIDHPEEIDLILITHFHIDHCAALPYFTERYPFKGRIFATHATKAVMKLLLSDNIRLQNDDTALYTEEDLQNCIDKIEVLDYHQTMEYKGIKFTATAAGHVLGAAMFMIDIDGRRVLYTGDYSLEEDRHLIQAEMPAGGPPDVLIVESTFGVTNIPPREKRELDFTRTVESIVSRGGSCLIPVFALGRAQELLLILDEYWHDNQELQNIPIFYASKLATKSLRVFQTFINMMNNNVRDQMDQFHNPFKLRHIKSIQSSEFDLLGPCVVMASPGFLQSGVSRHLFETWCDDEKHGVVIAGYTIEGTLANDLLSFPTEVKCLDNRIKPRRIQVEYISFSAHVDFNQNKQFIKSVMPDNIILVHGEKTNMRRLKEGLENDIKKNWNTTHVPHIETPEIGQKVIIPFRKNIMAEVVGSTAESLLASLDSSDAAAAANGTAATDAPPVALPSSLVLVTEHFSSKIVALDELPSYSSCKFGKITQRMVIPVPVSTASMLFGAIDTSVSNNSTTHSNIDVNTQYLTVLSSYMEDIFDDMDLTEDETGLVLQGMVTVMLGYNEGGVKEGESYPSKVLICWHASPVSDTVADSAAGVIMQMMSTPNVLRRSLARGNGSKARAVSIKR